MAYGCGQGLGTLFGAIIRKAFGFRRGLEIVSVFYILLAGYGILQLIGYFGIIEKKKLIERRSNEESVE